MANIGELNASLVAEVSRYVGPMQQATAATQSFSAATKDATASQIKFSSEGKSAQDVLNYMKGITDANGHAMQGMAAATDEATAATKGLTMSAEALQMAIGLGVTAAIMVIIKAYEELTRVTREAKEAADELISAWERTSGIAALDKITKATTELTNLQKQKADMLAGRSQEDFFTGAGTKTMAALDDRIAELTLAIGAATIETKVAQQKIGDAGPGSASAGTGARAPKAPKFFLDQFTSAAGRGGIDSTMIKEVQRILREAMVGKEKGGDSLDKIVADMVAPIHARLKEEAEAQVALWQRERELIANVGYAIDGMMRGIVTLVKYGAFDIVGAFSALIQEILKAVRGGGGGPLGFIGNILGAGLGIPGLGDIVGGIVGGLGASKSSVALNVSMGQPMTPMEAARDMQWQQVFRETARVANSQGFVLNVAYAR